MDPVMLGPIDGDGGGGGGGGERVTTKVRVKLARIPC